MDRYRHINQGTLRRVWALLLLLALSLSLCACAREEAYRTIVVATVEGSVLVSNEKNQNTPAYAGMALFDGDAVTVAEGGKLTIELDGDKYVMAEGGTSFRLEASGKPGSDKTVIHLESGGVLNRLKNELNEQQSYVITTPVSTISVRGTVYYVEITEQDGKDLTDCHIFDGRVEVTPIDGNGQQAEPPQLIPAGSVVSVIEISVEETGSVQSSAFVRDGEGNVEQPVDYSAVPETVIEELIRYADDGEELSTTKEELEQYVHTHTYADTWSMDGEQHWHEMTCEHQGAAQSRGDVADHIWDGGTQSQSTHTANGSVTDTCAVCGYAKTEETDKLPAHTWNGWTPGADGSTHTRACACGESETAAHTWDGGGVTQKATHTAAGVKTYTCTDCGAARTEPIAKTTAHQWGDWTAGPDEHSRSCPCGAVQTGTHAGGKATCTARARCQICDGAYGELAQTHSFAGNWYQGKTGHYQICMVCQKAASEEKPHTLDQGEVTAAATHLKEGTKTYTCTACGHVETAAIGKLPTHQWGQWTAQEKGHSRACPCGQTESKAHVFDAGEAGTNAAGAPASIFTCSVCHYQKVEHQHIYGAGIPGTDAAGNPVSLFACIYCGQEITYTAHTCQADTANMQHTEFHHWVPCKTQGCPAQLEYQSHTIKTEILSLPTHDQPGIQVDQCRCGWHREEKREFEFSDLYIHFDADCGQPDWTVAGPNQMVSSQSFDYSKIKVYGTYSDSYDSANGEILLKSNGTPVYGRLLSSGEYALAFSYGGDFIEGGSLLNSTAADYLKQGRHRIRVDLRDNSVPVWEVFDYKVLIHETHTLGYGAQDSAGHRVTCALDECMFTAYIESHQYTKEDGSLNIVDMAGATHTEGCVLCGYEKVTDHYSDQTELHCGEQCQCVACGQLYGEVKQHSFGEGVVGTDPATGEPATVYTCTECGYVKYEK